jgi:hypothetical protein
MKGRKLENEEKARHYNILKRTIAHVRARSDDLASDSVGLNVVGAGCLCTYFPVAHISSDGSKISEFGDGQHVIPTFVSA